VVAQASFGEARSVLVLVLVLVLVARNVWQRWLMIGRQRTCEQHGPKVADSCHPRAKSPSGASLINAVILIAEG
jgi:hypothetical protein